MDPMLEIISNLRSLKVEFLRDENRKTDAQLVADIDAIILQVEEMAENGDEVKHLRSERRFDEEFDN
jgi:hypothetical protein